MTNPLMISMFDNMDSGPKQLYQKDIPVCSMRRQKVGDIYEKVKDTEDIVRMSNSGLARVLKEKERMR